MWRTLVVCALMSCSNPTPEAAPTPTPEVRTPAEQVRAHLKRIAPAVMGHRGTGKTRAGHPHPENALSALRAAVAAGAHGVEIDVELTSDGALLVMHDDTMDRTTTITGCVSALTFEAARAARLLDGEGKPTSERAPTLEEVMEAVPAPGVVNIELKVFGEDCRTPTTGPVELANAVVAEVRRLKVEGRVVLSSFDDAAVAQARKAGPELYVGLLGDVPRVGDHEAYVADALALGVHAIHPSLVMTAEGVHHALAAGLQVNMWTVNGEAPMRSAIERGVTCILTDEPAALKQLLASD